MSRRKEIRKAIQTLLVGKTLAGDRVYSNLSSAYRDDDFPQIVIYTRSENVEEMSAAPLEFKRDLEVEITLLATGSEDPNEEPTYAEDLVDDLAEQVERELFRDDRLGEFVDATGKKVALVDSLQIQALEFEFRGDGEKPIAAARLNLIASYSEYRPFSLDEQEGIEPYLRSNVKWKVGHNDSAPDSSVDLSDDLTIPD